MKKILTAILSIAMLFAFAACSNNAPVSYLGKQVESVTAVSFPDYLVGEVLNPSDVTLRVLYDDDSTASFTAAELGLVRKTASGALATDPYTLSSSIVKDGYVTFQVYYGSDSAYGSGEKNSKEWNIYIPVYTAEKIVVDVTNAPSAVSVVPTLATEGLAFSAEYNNGETKPVTYDFAKAYLTTDDVFEYDAETLTEDAATVVVKDNVKAELSAAWDVEIVDDPSTIITGFSIAPAANNEVFNVTGSTSKISDLKYDVTVRYQDNSSEVVKFANLTSKHIAVTFKDYASETYKLVDAKTNTFEATITYNNAGYTFTDTADLTVTYADDYPTGQISVAAKNAGKEYEEGTPIPLTDFTFTTSTWKSGSTSSRQLTDAEIAANVSCDPLYVKTGATSCTVTFKAIGKGAATVTFDKTLTLTIAD